MGEGVAAQISQRDEETPFYEEYGGGSEGEDGVAEDEEVGQEVG